MFAEARTEARTVRVIRASAWYDLLVTAPFATPWTARWVLDRLAGVHDALGLDGVVPVAADPFTLLFANLLGSIVVVWSLVRLARPTPLLGATDTLGRALFSLWFGYAWAHDGSATLVLFLVLEVGWGLVQGIAVAGPVRAGLRHRRVVPC